MNKLLLNLILNRSKTKNNQGFSLFEVTISILVSSAFLMGTLQAMTINAVMQVKAERQAQANFWIQQDIEKLQAAASALKLKNYVQQSGETPEQRDIRLLLNPDNKTESRICYRFSRTKLADVRFGADLVKVLNKQLQDDFYADGVTKNTGTKSEPAINNTTVFSTAQTFKQFKTDEQGNVLYTNGQPVLNDQKDSVQTTVNQKVVPQILRNGSDDETSPDFQNNLLNKNYRLVRLIAADSSTRYDVLQVYYRLGEPYDSTDPNQTDQDGDKLRDDEPDRKSIIAENYTEVIPAAVADCGF